MMDIPKTPEEIVAAKTWLREAFSHAAENLEKYLKSPAGADDIAKLKQDLTDREKRLASKPATVQEKLVSQWKETAKAHSLPEDALAAEVELLRRDAKTVAKIMTNGSHVGNRYLDDFVKLWQEKGQRPSSRYLPS